MMPELQLQPDIKNNDKEMNKVKEAYYNTKTGFRGKSALKKEGIKNAKDGDVDEFYDKNQSTRMET